MASILLAMLFAFWVIGNQNHLNIRFPTLHAVKLFRQSDNKTISNSFYRDEVKTNFGFPTNLRWWHKRISRSGNKIFSVRYWHILMHKKWQTLIKYTYFFWNTLMKIISIFIVHSFIVTCQGFFFFSLLSADQQQLASLFLTALNSVKHDCSLSLNSLTA